MRDGWLYSGDLGYVDEDGYFFFVGRDDDVAILVDDEPLLVDYLSDHLGRLWPELEIVGRAHSGQQGLELARTTTPDIALLDIHMPGMNGLQLAAALDARIRVVFVTAFDQYAVEAFEQAALSALRAGGNATRSRSHYETLVFSVVAIGATRRRLA